MIENWFLKILLLPFAALYFLVVSLRKFAYDIALLRSSRFDIPTICIGNLSVGGVGKTPHVEFLTEMLSPYIEIGILSRGYRRKTEGFMFVNEHHTALEVGDEPLQYRRKYPSVVVAVGEQRAFAIPNMLYKFPNIQAILLDDAYQHLAVKPYMNILITEYNHPFFNDMIVPIGRLREGRSGYKRADIIVVSKSPQDLQETDRQSFVSKIKPLAHQSVYFSTYEYGEPYHIFQPDLIAEMSPETHIVLISGIARPEYLVQYLSEKVGLITSVEYEDHRQFTNYDVARLKQIFDDSKAEKKLIFTTEKDATRLDMHRSFLEKNQMHIFAVPIKVKIMFDEQAAFDSDIKKRLLDFKV